MSFTDSYQCSILLRMGMTFSLLYGSSVKTRMQYKITMKYEDAHAKTKIFTDHEIPKNRQVVKSGIS